MLDGLLGEKLAFQSPLPFQLSLVFRFAPFHLFTFFALNASMHCLVDEILISFLFLKNILNFNK
jgi:hypothetical protein